MYVFIETHHFQSHIFQHVSAGGVVATPADGGRTGPGPRGLDQMGFDPQMINDDYTSSTAQGGGGSFKNRKPIGEIGCCESGMAERSHWWTERCLRSPLFLSL